MHLVNKANQVVCAVLALQQGFGIKRIGCIDTPIIQKLIAMMHMRTTVHAE